MKLHASQDRFQKDVVNPWLIAFHKTFLKFSKQYSYLASPIKLKKAIRLLDIWIPS